MPAARAIDSFWAGFFGVEPDVLPEPELQVVPPSWSGARHGGRGAAAAALARARPVVYPRPMENEAARRVARRLGLGFYASHLAVRLGPA